MRDDPIISLAPYKVLCNAWYRRECPCKTESGYIIASFFRILQKPDCHIRGEYHVGIDPKDIVIFCFDRFPYKLIPGRVYQAIL